MTKAFCSLLIFTALLAVGQSSARLDPSAARPASVAQIQSPSLRIEFDQNMHSRVIARFGEKDYPKPTGVHQVMLMLPSGAQREGLRLKGELEVKGVRYPVRWACRQKVNSDGSLTLRHNYKPEQPLV